MVTIFICDDDEIICEKNKVEIRKICKQHEIVVAIATFYSGEALLRRLSTNPHDADVILLDILMKETNGAQVAKQLRNMKSSAEIIFLTSSEDYVFDVFETNPIQYLIKGNENSGKLEHALLKAIEISQKKRTEIFLVNSEGEKFQIPYRDIFYFEISLRIVDIHYDDKVLGFTSSMKCLKDEVGKKGFVQTSRSLLVNIRNIDEIRGGKIRLTNGEWVPLSPKYASQTIEAFKSFMYEEE